MAKVELRGVPKGYDVGGKLLDYQRPERRGRLDWFEWLIVFIGSGIVLYVLFLTAILLLSDPF